jgi:hypothetical protein
MNTMMDRVDRVQVAVRSTEQAAATFNRLLGTEIVREVTGQYLSAHRTILAFGESEIELCEPDGAGYVADFLTKRGEGLMTAGLSCAQPARLAERLQALNYNVYEDNGQYYLPGEEHFGTAFVISETRPRNRIGPVSFLFEVTPTFLTDWRQVAAHFAGIFGLDPSRFVTLKSKAFGYDGSLTMFDPPNRLDRLELAQVVSKEVPMSRWVERNGDSLYMCSCETHDIENLVNRFIEAGVRWIPRGKIMAEERDGFWTHPGDLHGLLLGVSRTTVPWEFSGRPEFADPPSGPTKY